VSDSIYYQLIQDGRTLSEASAISFTTDQNAPGWKVSKATPGTHSGVLTPVIWQKSKTVADEYSSLRLDFNSQLSIEWRVFNNGIAWRWINNSTKAYKVIDEQSYAKPGPGG